MLEPTTAAQRILDVLLQEPDRAQRAAMLPGCFEAPSSQDSAEVGPAHHSFVTMSRVVSIGCGKRADATSSLCSLHYLPYLQVTECPLGLR